MPVPVVPTVAARPDVEADVGAVVDRNSWAASRLPDGGVLVADVEPDRRVVGRRAPRQRDRSWRAKSARLSNPNEMSSEPRAKTAGEWPPTAQKRSGASRPRSSAPKPPIEMPPIATRSRSAPLRSRPAGITSSRTYEPHGASARSCHQPVSPSGSSTTGARSPSRRSAVMSAGVSRAAWRAAVSVQEDEQRAALTTAGAV